MPIYRVTVNRPLPADDQGRIYNHLALVMKGTDRDANCRIGAVFLQVLSTDPRASIPVGAEFSVTPTPA